MEFQAIDILELAKKFIQVKHLGKPKQTFLPMQFNKWCFSDITVHMNHILRCSPGSESDLVGLG